LDVIAKAHIREFIKRINKTGTTFILTTHDLEDVKQLADHVIIINHGVKVFDDTLQNLQINLGEKKIVELTLSEEQHLEASAISFFGNDNFKIIEEKSPLEFTMEVDTSKIAINEFIEFISRKLNFSDISVKELPMEKIITQIYSEENNEKEKV